MGRRLKVSTIVPVPYGKGPGGESYQILNAGDELPDWAEDLVGDHVFEGDAAADAPASPDGSGDAPDGPPPKTGPGSGVKAWLAYAKDRDVVVPDDAKREDVIAALEAAGVPTEPAAD